MYLGHFSSLVIFVCLRLNPIIKLTTLPFPFFSWQENAHRECQLCQGQYWVLRQSEWCYKIIRNNFKPTKSCVSRFAYVRQVDIDPITHVMKCSCLFWERHGIPCRHLYVLLQKPTITDFDVRWWSAYGAYYGETGMLQ